MKAMKTIMLILVLSVLATGSQAQTALFETLTGKYSDKDGFSASEITSDMFDLYIKKRNIDENSPVYDALKNLDNILVVSQTSRNGWRNWHTDTVKRDADVDEIYQTALNHYTRNKYTLFKTEKQMGEEVKVFLRKNNDKIESLALITNSGWAANLVELTGSIDLATVSQLNQILNLRGLENLYKINNAGFRGMPVPPAPFSEQQLEEMMEKNREIIEKQQYLTEEQRRNIEERAHAMVQKQMKLAEKQREMEEKYGRQPIFLSSPGDSTVFYIDGKKANAEDVRNLNPNDIERVEVNKDTKEGNVPTIRITTRK